MQQTRLCAFVLAAGLFTLMAQADDLVLADHFDDGTLDPAWEIEFSNADGWTFAESGSNLTVSAIDHVEPNEWSRVQLSQSVDPLDDFRLVASIHWASLSQPQVMQYLRILAYDGTDQWVAIAYFWDAWFDWRGTLGGCLSGACQDPGHSVAPFDGTALLEIERVGSDTTVRIDGTLILQNNSDEPVERVGIEFGFYPRDVGGGGVASLFGTEAIDFIELTALGNSCLADHNNDGVLDFFDVLSFLNAFTSQDQSADLNNDTVWDFFDVQAYLNLFATGCP